MLNVHVNRAPAELAVESKYYREGEYLDARNSECARRNEAMTIAGTASAAGKKFPMAVRQISGAIARRIVCPVEPGRQLKKGEVYGMIKFGSRTELYLPLDGVEINVKVGDRVYGGRNRDGNSERISHYETAFPRTVKTNGLLKCVPNSLTLCNSLCSFAAILYTLRAYERFYQFEQRCRCSQPAPVLICCAMIFDAFDGFAARRSTRRACTASRWIRWRTW